MYQLYLPPYDATPACVALHMTMSWYMFCLPLQTFHISTKLKSHKRAKANRNNNIFIKTYVNTNMCDRWRVASAWLRGCWRTPSGNVELLQDNTSGSRKYDTSEYHISITIFMHEKSKPIKLEISTQKLSQTSANICTYGKTRYVTCIPKNIHMYRGT